MTFGTLIVPHKFTVKPAVGGTVSSKGSRGEF